MYFVYNLVICLLIVYYLDEVRLQSRIESIGAACSSAPAVDAATRVEAVARRVRSRLQGN